MRQIIGANRETVKILKKLVGQHRIAGYLTHHDEAQTILATLEAMLREQFRDFSGLSQRTHKRHHDFNIGQAHVVAHTLEGLALHRKGFTEIFADVTRRTAKTEHWVFFFGLVARAANQLAVFVGLEV